MPLIYSEAFEPLFSQFSGLRLGYVQMDGNVGDKMIADATFRLLNTFEIPFARVSSQQIFDKSIPDDVDELVVSGGGNLGTFYPKCYELRRAALECGLPVTVLPQSFASVDEDLSGFKRVYVRETTSLAADSSLTLMPDLALAFEDVDGIQPPHFDLGIFLRTDGESVFDERSLSLVDPVTNNNTPLEYVEFASLFGHVVTDRLHFAIAALIAGRRTSLLPNTTGKNRAMYETWLRDLGCEWLQDVDSLRYDVDALKQILWTRLVPLPESVLPWHTVCREAEVLEPEVVDDQVAFLDENGRTIARVDENAFTVWSFCDGKRGIGEVACAVAEAYAEPVSTIGAEVASTVSELHWAGILLRERKEILIDVLADETFDGWVYRRASVVHPDRQRTELWFAVPLEYASTLTDGADCFLIAMLMQAMSHKLSLRVRGGTVSAALVENLMRFQEHWKDWRPQFAIADIEADVGASREHPAGRGLIAAFSGGLDSCYTLFMHNKAAESRLPRIDAVAMVHGFDIPLTDARGFAGAKARAERLTREAGTVLLPLATNLRGVHFDGQWEDRHATALAAGLTVCSGGYAAGIVSSTMNVGFPTMFGSNPVTDPLLGSDRFSISHFGFEASRFEKFRALSTWPSAIDNLRVCWQYEHRDRNCGRCQKCVLTLLSLRCLGLSTACFEDPADGGELARLIPDGYPGGLNLFDLRELAQYARDQGIDTPWSHRLTELRLN